MNKQTNMKWEDYTAHGKYVVQVHRENSLLSRVIDTENGRSKTFRGKTSHHDAMRWASDQELADLYG